MSQGLISAAHVTYSWSRRGEQKRIEQTKKKGKRLNVCGLLEVGKGFEYGLALKSFKSVTQSPVTSHARV